MPGPALRLATRGRCAAKGAALVATILLIACAPSSDGEDRAPAATAARGTGFDFYVLSLAWSPTYCAEKADQANRRQCGPERDFAFIVHGLWPQFERGYPEFCSSSEPQRVPDKLVATMVDIIPSAGLIGHQWRKHGTCTGMNQADYLEATRDAYERIAVPPAFLAARVPAEARPDAVERAFIETNPGLPPDGIAVTCSAGRLDEVRICLTRDFAFRSCPEVDQRACSAPTVAVPAAP